MAMGKKNKSSELDKAFDSDTGMFWLGSLDYGFTTTTLNSAAILNEDYQSGGLGFTQMLGALSLSANVSKASYDNGEEKTGQSFSAKYAKSFTDRTDLQLLTYRYQSKGYVEFADFNPKDMWRYTRYGDQRSRYEARLSQRFDGTMNTVSNLPKDRESLFWLNVQEVPPKPEVKDGEGSVLAMAMNTRVKLIYRPAIP